MTPFLFLLACSTPPHEPEAVPPQIPAAVPEKSSAAPGKAMALPGKVVVHQCADGNGTPLGGLGMSGSGLGGGAPAGGAPAGGAPAGGAPAGGAPAGGAPAGGISGLVGTQGTGGGTGLGGLGTKGRGAGQGGMGTGSGYGRGPTVPTAPRTEGGGTLQADPATQGNSEKTSAEWGAEIYLSNDDSMSLASAQRLLWAAEQGASIQTSEVRPHELLNYFHFDGVEPKAGETFGIQASALADEAGKLTLALSIAGAKPPRLPLDLSLVLDRSGSMAAEGRMEYLKRGLHQMEHQLQPGDRLDIVFFDDELCNPLENYVVGRDDAALLTAAIDALAPRASTNLDLGLKEGYRLAATHTEAGRNRRMIVITDALLNTGDVNEDTVTQIGKAYEESGIRLTGVGVGRDFNDAFLNKLTEKGHGSYVYLGSEAVVDRIFGPGFGSLTQTLAHDVKFSLDLPDSLAMERFYGEEASTRAEDVQPIDYQSGTAQLFLQDLRVRESGLQEGDALKLTIRWKDPQTDEAHIQQWSTLLSAALGASAHNVWKGRALMAWSDLALARSQNQFPCNAKAEGRWQSALRQAGEDTELSWLSPLTSRLCADGGAWNKAATMAPMNLSANAQTQGHVAVDQITAVGTIELNDVKRVMRRNANQIRYCYQRELVKNPNLTGKMTAKVVIANDGSVASSSVGSSTLPEVEACINSQFLRMHFPPPNNGVVVVQIPMTFKP